MTKSLKLYSIFKATWLQPSGVEFTSNFAGTYTTDVETFFRQVWPTCKLLSVTRIGGANLIQD
jgi:hypothetical protein